MKFNKFSNKIFIIGIAGASGCGKTFFAKFIKQKLEKKGIKNIDIISCDNYYISYPNNKKAPPDFNWDKPDVLDLDLLYKHLIMLQNSEKVEIPHYDFITSQRNGIDRIIDGSIIKIIIVEGLFVLFDENLRNIFNLKLFTLLDSDICLARRLIRDVDDRQISLKDTLRQYQLQVKPGYVNYIEPTKKYADLIISTDEFSDSSKSINIIGTHILNELEKRKNLNELNRVKKIIKQKSLNGEYQNI